MSEEVIENKLTQPTRVGNRSIRTESQLAVLAKAREKALSIRRFNITVKNAQKGIEIIETAKTKNDILAKHKKLLEPEQIPIPVPVEVVPVLPKKSVPVPNSDDDEEQEIILIKKKKKKPKQKIIYYTDSDSDNEPPPPILIKKTRIPIPIPVPVPVEVPVITKKKFKNPLKY
jgi:hypothetical protein